MRGDYTLIMIKVFNFPNVNSKVEGWRIHIDNKADFKYRLKLFGETSSRIGMIIDNDDYKDLTIPEGIYPYSMSKMVSIKTIDE